MTFIKHIFLSSAALTFLAARLGAAETAADQPAELAEIIVTAEKRAENIEKVPVSIQAFSENDLIAQQIRTSEDLKFLSPSLSYNNSAGYAQPYLRGIGTDLTQPNVDPDVATYVDGLYIANTQGSSIGLLGVQRVEVLQGPQGTLYGRNAIGGAINIVTMTPGNTVEGNVTAGTGNFNRYETSGFVSGPMADNLSGGVYWLYDQQEGFNRRVVPLADRELSGDTPDGDQDWGVRGKLVYDIDWLRLVLSYEHDYSHTADNNLQNIQSTALGVLLGAPYNPTPHVNSDDAPDGTYTQSDTVIMNERVQLGFAQLVGISGYRKFVGSTYSDFDGTQVPIAALAATDPTTQYSQELQLLSDSEGKLKWIVGLYGYSDKSGYTNGGTQTLSGLLFNSILPPYNPYDGLLWDSQSYAQVQTTSGALFAQASYALTDALRLTLGGRFSYDHKKEEGLESQFRQIIGGQLSGPAYYATTYPDQNASWRNFTPKVGLDYTIDQTLLYASWSKGYKPGVYNAATPPDTTPLGPERLNAFELGSKSSLFDRRMLLNTSAYYYKFKDIQTQIVNPLVYDGRAALYGNGNATAYGFETTMNARITEGLEYKGSGSWEHGKYDSWNALPAQGGFPAPVYYLTYTPTPGGNVGINDNPKGNDMVRTPEWVFTSRLQYTKGMPFGGSLQIAGDWYYTSHFFWENSNQVKQPGYSLFGASSTYILPDATWKITAWGKNLANKNYTDAGFITGFGTVVNWAPPRTFGFTVSKDF